jgi:site-specific recombinase XerD
VKRIKYGDINDNVIDLTLKKKTSHGSKRLIVPLSKKALELIDLSTNPDNLIFPNLITSTKCAIHLKAITGVIGIKKTVTFHTARHTFATISLGLGIELKKVSELLGHDSIKTTEIYAHLVEEHLKEAVDKWDSF